MFGKYNGLARVQATMVLSAKRGFLHATAMYFHKMYFQVL